MNKKLNSKILICFFCILITGFIIVSIINKNNRKSNVLVEDLKISSYINMENTKITKKPIRDKENIEDINIKKDLDMDGIDESITIKFDSGDTATDDQKIKILINSNNNDYTFEEGNLSGVIPEVHFAKFDSTNVYFYINCEGLSDDPASLVYKFSNGKIEKVIQTIGYIKNYDGEGKITTNYSLIGEKSDLILSCYDINKTNPTFNKKENIIGKNINYPHKLILFSESRDKNIAYKSYVDDGDYLNNLMDIYGQKNIVKIIEKNEELTIVDVDYTYQGEFPKGITKNIPIKVKDSNGNIGWLLWLNGGD